MKGQILIPIFYGSFAGGKFNESSIFFLSSFMIGIFSGILLTIELPLLAFILIFLSLSYLCYRSLLTIVGLLDTKTKIILKTKLLAISNSFFLFLYSFYFSLRFKEEFENYEITTLVYITLGLSFCMVSSFVIDFDK